MWFSEFAAQANCSLGFLSQHPLQHLQKYKPLIARVPQNILRASAAFPCSSCKTGVPFLSTMPMADRLAEDGLSSAEQKVFGESPRSRRYATDYSSSTISSPTRSLNGRATRANRRSPSVSCSVKPTALKALHVFSVHRSATEMPWRFDCRSLLNPARLSFMARVIRRFFWSCCAEN